MDENPNLPHLLRNIWQGGVHIVVGHSIISKSNVFLFFPYNTAMNHSGAYSGCVGRHEKLERLESLVDALAKSGAPPVQGYRAHTPQGRNLYLSTINNLYRRIKIRG